MTTLRFTGDFALWLGLVAALGIALVAGWLYRRETKSRKDALRWVLPLLRSLAIFILMLILTGPVLKHTSVIGEMARVLLLVDNSASMGLEDSAMEPHRKLLVAQQYGWLRAGTYDPSLKLALDAIRQARAGSLPATRKADAKELRKLAKTLSAQVNEAARKLGEVRSDTWPKRGDAENRFRRDLVNATKTLADADFTNTRRYTQEFVRLNSLLKKWEQTLQQAYDDYFIRLAGGGDESVKQALKQFDALTRAQRLDPLLLTNKVLAQLAAKHNVEVRAFGSEDATLWRASAAEGSEQPPPPASFGLTPTARSTDLTGALRRAAEQLPTGERGALVLLTDGQHNRGDSPLTLARTLGNRSLPVFTIGLGAQTQPEDLALLSVTGPQSVFVEDRLKGELVVRDNLPKGVSFVAKIEAGGRAVWAKTLTAEQRDRRAISFDFPVKDIADFSSGDRDVKLGASPVTLRASLAAVGPERQTNNNMATFRFLAVNQRPKVLILDGRPRWEFRYLRNLFERDEKWDINALLAGAGGGEFKPWPRGTGEGKFPADRETLFTYHLIIFGDLPPTYLKPEELTWIKEFVENRGGGVIFIDGRQEQLANYASTPLTPLLPVSWKGVAPEGADIRLALTPRGAGVTPLTLLPNAAENTALWSRLPAPRWIAPTLPLPGTDVLMEATLGQRKVPALVFRRYGAGRVLYSGFEESWRWRMEFADLYHQKFWNQMARWIMDAPYPVADKFVSLDAGLASYEPGEMAEFRAQIRDAQGKVTAGAKAEAQLFRNGHKIASLALTAEEGATGVYRARTAALAEGNYEVRVRVDGVPETEMKARAGFVVEPPGNAELAELTCNEPLLRELAELTGGEFFREEEALQLVDRLAPLSRSKVVETETVLWQGWWWFGAVVVLLTAEWVVRKRAGLL